MKKIAALTGLPRDDELKITSRAEKLMNDWSEFITREGDPVNGKVEAADDKSAPEESVGEPAADPPKESTTAETTVVEEIQLDV